MDDMLKSLGIHKGDMGSDSANSKYLRVKMEKVSHSSPKKLKRGGSSGRVEKDLGGWIRGAASKVGDAVANSPGGQQIGSAFNKVKAFGQKDGGQPRRKKFFGGQLLGAAGNAINGATRAIGNAVANSPGGQQISGVVNQAKRGMGLKDGGSTRKKKWSGGSAMTPAKLLNKAINPVAAADGGRIKKTVMVVKSKLGGEGKGRRKLGGDTAMPDTAPVDQTPVAAKNGGRACKAAGGVGKVRKGQYV